MGEKGDAEPGGLIQHCFFGLVEHLQLVLETDEADAAVALLL